MRYILYTTTSSSWYQKEAHKAALFLSKTKGRGLVKVEVRHIRAPRNPQLIVDDKGSHRLSWDWFQTYFPKDGYDGVGFHFTPYYKKKWGIKGDWDEKKKKHKPINGSKHTQNKDYPEFWMCCEKENAKGYDFISNFVRLLVHEISHFDEDLDDNNGNKLTQESVHRWDYEFKAIHHYPKFVDYRGYILKRKVNKLINEVIDFIRNAITI